MRQSGANGPGLSTGDPTRRARTGRTRIVLLAVIGLLLAVLSSLVIAASAAHALGPVTGQPTTTTVTVDDPSSSVPEYGYVNFVIKVTYSGGTGVSTEGAINVYTGSDLLCSTTDQSYGAQAVATYPDGYAGVGECAAYVGLSPGVYPITADFLGNGVPVTGPAASVGLTTLTVTSAPPVPTNPDLLITSAASVTFGTSVTYSFDYFDSPPGYLLPITVFIGSQPLCEGYGTCTSTAAPIGTDTVTAVWNSLTETASLTVSPPPVSTPTPPTPTPTPPPAPTPTPTPTPPPVVTSPTTTSQHGYWLVGSDGGIFSFGSAQFYGSTGSLRLQRPVVGITPTSNDSGYWLVASDGGIFSFGNAGFYGSIPGLGIFPYGTECHGANCAAQRVLDAPIVGMVPSADGGGYFMVGGDGGVFTFGDAKFEGSCPGIGGCAGGAAVAVMPDATGNGYWVVTANGDVQPFGDAVRYGGPGPFAGTVTSAARSFDGGGYYILGSDGEVFAYGDAAYRGNAYGSVVEGSDPASAIFTTADGGGYWVASAEGSVFTYGDAPYEGGESGVHLNGSIIAATGW